MSAKHHSILSGGEELMIMISVYFILFLLSPVPVAAAARLLAAESITATTRNTRAYIACQRQRVPLCQAKPRGWTNDCDDQIVYGSRRQSAQGPTVFAWIQHSPQYLDRNDSGRHAGTPHTCMHIPNQMQSVQSMVQQTLHHKQRLERVDLELVTLV